MTKVYTLRGDKLELLKVLPFAYRRTQPVQVSAVGSGLCESI